MIISNTNPNGSFAFLVNNIQMWSRWSSVRSFFKLSLVFFLTFIGTSYKQKAPYLSSMFVPVRPNIDIYFFVFKLSAFNTLCATVQHCCCSGFAVHNDRLFAIKLQHVWFFVEKSCRSICQSFVWGLVVICLPLKYVSIVSNEL